MNIDDMIDNLFNGNIYNLVHFSKFKKLDNELQTTNPGLNEVTTTQ
jgi:hypothetical protein